MDFRSLLSLVSLLQKKSTWVIIAALGGGYFMFDKYENQITEKAPQLKEVKEKIDRIKSLVS